MNPAAPSAPVARPGRVWSPVLTPFEADGRPSCARAVRHARWLLGHGVGLALFGTNSEANSMSVREKRGLLDCLLEHGLPAERMLPGTGACALGDTLELTRHAVDAGCAGVLVLPPFFYKGVADEGLYRSFAQLIDKVADARLRVYLYNIPSMTGLSLGVGLVERLLRSFPGTLAGIKDSSGDWTYTSALLAQLQPRGLDVYAGSETSLLPTLRAGGAGCITATANVNPAAIVELADRWHEPGAEDRQERLNMLRAIFQRRPIIAAMKSALAWQTAAEGWRRVRPPLVELDDGTHAALCDELEGFGFTIPDVEALVDGSSGG